MEEEDSRVVGICSPALPVSCDFSLCLSVPAAAAASFNGGRLLPAYCRSAMDRWAASACTCSPAWLCWTWTRPLASRTKKVQALAWQLALITTSNSRGFTTDHWQFRVLLLLIDCFWRVRAWHGWVNQWTGTRRTSAGARRAGRAEPWVAHVPPLLSRRLLGPPPASAYCLAVAWSGFS